MQMAVLELAHRGQLIARYQCRRLPAGSGTQRRRLRAPDRRQPPPNPAVGRPREGLGHSVPTRSSIVILSIFPPMRHERLFGPTAPGNSLEPIPNWHSDN